MAWNPPSGKGKGPGNGSPRKNFTSETAKAAGEKGNAAITEYRTLREKMRAYREANEPGPEDRPEPPDKRRIEELARSHGPDSLAALAQIALHPKMMPMARVKAAEVLLDRGYGKAIQGVDMKVKIDPNQMSDEELAIIAAGGCPPSSD